MNAEAIKHPIWLRRAYSEIAHLSDEQFWACFTDSVEKMGISKNLSDVEFFCAALTGVVDWLSIRRVALREVMTLKTLDDAQVLAVFAVIALALGLKNYAGYLSVESAYAMGKSDTFRAARPELVKAIKNELQLELFKTQRKAAGDASGKARARAAQEVKKRVEELARQMAEGGKEKHEISALIARRIDISRRQVDRYLNAFRKNQDINTVDD